MADDAFQRLLYPGHRLAENPLGHAESIQAIGLADLQRYHATALKPLAAALHVTGAVSRRQVAAAVDRLAKFWKGQAPALPPPPPNWSPAHAGLYFADVPGASQSVLRIGYPALALADRAFYPATVMNFRLGGGGFASQLTQVLRESRGYSYEIESSFSGTEIAGPFRIQTLVRANVTLEALCDIKSMVDGYGVDFNEADLEETQGFLQRANAPEPSCFLSAGAPGERAQSGALGGMGQLDADGSAMAAIASTSTLYFGSASPTTRMRVIGGRRSPNIARNARLWRARSAGPSAY